MDKMIGGQFRLLTSNNSEVSLSITNQKAVAFESLQDSVERCFFNANPCLKGEVEIVAAVRVS